MWPSCRYRLTFCQRVCNARNFLTNQVGSKSCPPQHRFLHSFRATPKATTSLHNAHAQAIELPTGLLNLFINVATSILFLLLISGRGLGTGLQPKFVANTVLVGCQHPMYLEIVCFGPLWSWFCLCMKVFVASGSNFWGSVGVGWGMYVVPGPAPWHCQMFGGPLQQNTWFAPNQGHQLYGPLLHVMSTAWYFWMPFQQRTNLQGDVAFQKQVPPASLTAKHIVTTCISIIVTNFIPAPPSPKGDSPYKMDKGMLAFTQPQQETPNKAYRVYIYIYREKHATASPTLQYQ